MTDSISIFSTRSQLEQLQIIITNYLRLPFATGIIPGSLLEAGIGYVHKAQVLQTYDFVDVISPTLKIGWQIKSTKDTTPVTWGRAKIPNASSLIEASHDDDGLQKLGDSILDFCNSKAKESLFIYNLERIGFARLVVFPDNRIMYYERLLIGSINQTLFNPADYIWKWSKQKEVVKKEQLSSLFGIHKATGKKHFAWHGLGENQLHFSGEKIWWPPPSDPHRLDFKAPEIAEKVNFKILAEWLAQLKVESL